VYARVGNRGLYLEARSRFLVNESVKKGSDDGVLHTPSSGGERSLPCRDEASLGISAVLVGGLGPAPRNLSCILKPNP
jgi:hypothetical protein